MPSKSKYPVIVEERGLYKEMWRKLGIQKVISPYELSDKIIKRYRHFLISVYSQDKVAELLTRIPSRYITICFLDICEERDMLSLLSQGVHSVYSFSHIRKCSKNKLYNLFTLPRQVLWEEKTWVGYLKSVRSKRFKINFFLYHFYGFKLSYKERNYLYMIMNQDSKAEMKLYIGLTEIKYNRMISDMKEKFKVDNETSLRNKIYCLGWCKL